MKSSFEADGAGADTRDCPERPTSTRPDQLGFVRMPMVRWLDPRQLLDTAARVIVSNIFGAYSDKRELQGLTNRESYDRSEREDLWLDYVADLGDGWHPTYTMATLLASEQLKLEWEGESHPTERGRVLVMGGDQVYPVPKRADYENRLLGPYRAALPCTHDHHPELFAIPGSHDWYDGLVNFTSVFCRGYWIGGWRTRQNRSYFALKLPHGWWLWGVDIQFGDYIDDAQLRYFSEVATSQVRPGDRIILCTAKALGTSAGHAHLYAERNLQYFRREVIRPTGADVVLEVASGRHHYARFQEKGGQRQHISSGGGGAFLHPTHHLPECLELEGDGRPNAYQRAVAYPSLRDSRKLRKRLWLLPFRNLSFMGFLGGVHVLVALMLGLHQGTAHQSLGVGDLWRALWTSPTAVLLILLMVVVFGGMVRFAHDAPGATRIGLGLVHSSMQLVALGAITVAAAGLSASFGLHGLASVTAFFVLLAVLGGVGGAVGLAAYLWATNHVGFHANEAYGPLRVMDFKHFLRLHIDTQGTLTVFPIGVDKVCRRWELRTEGLGHEAWFAPARDEVEAHLIERPFTVGK